MMASTFNSLNPDPSPNPNQDLSPSAAKLEVNEQLMMASTFNSLSLILKELAPTRGSSRMEVLEADQFVLTVSSAIRTMLGRCCDSGEVLTAGRSAIQTPVPTLL